MSVTEGPIRRSSRRAKKRPAYAVNDIVEINEAATDKGTRGRLLSKLPDSVVSPRWIVVFDDEKDPRSWTEQEVYESAFGDIVGKYTPPPTESKENKKTNSANKAEKKSRKRDASQLSSGSNSEDQGVGSGKKRKASTSQKKKESASASAAGSPSDGSLHSDDSKKGTAASAREARIRRRQASLKEENGKPAAAGTQNSVTKVSGKPTKKTAHQSAAGKVRSKKNGRFVSAKIHGKNGKPLRGAAAAAVAAANKDVVRIPMLTGTLILHRGKHRRAEFVRHV